MKYASNGFFGASVVEQRLLGVERGDLLGMLMTESVFGAHLVYEAETELFHVPWRPHGGNSETAERGPSQATSYPGVSFTEDEQTSCALDRVRRAVQAPNFRDGPE